MTLGQYSLNKKGDEILFETRRKNTALCFWIFKTWQEICISVVKDPTNLNHILHVCSISPYKSEFWHHVAQASVVKTSHGCNSAPESEYAETDRLIPCYITYLISILKLTIIKFCSQYNKYRVSCVYQIVYLKKKLNWCHIKCEQHIKLWDSVHFGMNFWIPRCKWSLRW